MRPIRPIRRAAITVLIASMQAYAIQMAMLQKTWTATGTMITATQALGRIVILILSVAVQLLTV